MPLLFLILKLLKFLQSATHEALSIHAIPCWKQILLVVMTISTITKSFNSFGSTDQTQALDNRTAQ